METEHKIELLNEIFERKLAADDLDKEVESSLEWDSFHIMNFLVTIKETYGRKISIEQISAVQYIRDLLQMMEGV